MGMTYDEGSQTTACRLARDFNRVRAATGRGEPDAAGARKMTELLSALARPARQSQGYSSPAHDRLMCWFGYADGSGLAIEICADELGMFAGGRGHMRTVVEQSAEDACLTAGDTRDLIRSVPLALAKQIREAGG